MDIPSVTAISLTPQPVVGARAPAPPQQVAADNAARDTTSQRSPGNTLAGVLSESEATRRSQKQQESQERASTARGNESGATVGRIRFELEDGTRIAKFFDTKDVLIYQVPPEGRIYLVKSEEASVQDQVETSA
ncbi:MAG: hypothetical protein AB1421_10610 [Pseudomonadota bacterium]